MSRGRFWQHSSRHFQFQSFDQAQSQDAAGKAGDGRHEPDAVEPENAGQDEQEEHRERHCAKHRCDDGRHRALEEELRRRQGGEHFRLHRTEDPFQKKSPAIA